jgi:hypothetical protein
MFQIWFLRFLSGYAHAGILEGANSIYFALITNSRFLNAATDDVLYTGHSLGDGVSAILLAKFSQFFSVSVNQFGMGFGTPAVLSNNIVVNNFVSFIFRDDFVPRLSVRSMESLYWSCYNQDVSWIPSCFPRFMSF